MESSHEHNGKHYQSSLFSLSCDSGKFSPYIHTEEANTLKFPCQGNGRRNTITCKDEHLNEFLTDVGTLDMNASHLKGVDLTLSEEVPVIPKKFFTSPPTLVSNEVVGISLKDIFVSDPLYLQDRRYRVSKKMKVNTNVLLSPVFQNKKVILLFDARDSLLEYLWENRDTLNLFETLSTVGFYAITTPNFSLFQGECPIGHAWNVKKGLVCGEELEKLGVSVIPHVYSIHPRQIERWVEWLNKHPTIKTVAMNCQLQRRSNAGRDIATTTIRHLLTNTDTNIILNGSDKRILSQLNEFKDRLHTASSGSFKKMEMMRSPQLIVSGFFTRKVSATP